MELKHFSGDVLVLWVGYIREIYDAVGKWIRLLLSGKVSVIGTTVLIKIVDELMHEAETLYGKGFFRYILICRILYRIRGLISIITNDAIFNTIYLHTLQ